MKYIELFLDGDVPSLKNSRDLRVVSGRPILAPSSRVASFLSETRRSFREQLKENYPDIKGFIQNPVIVVAMFWVYYETPTPNRDLDNAYTTIQEALEESVIQNDRQIMSFWPMTFRATGVSTERTQLYLWEYTGFDYLDEITKFIGYYKESSHASTSIELRPVPEVADRTSATNPF